MSRIVPVVVALLAVFTGIAPVYSAEKKVSVEGRSEETRTESTVTGVVVDDDSRSASGVLLSLSGPVGTSLVVSDERGRFTFTNLIPGRYLIRTHLNASGSARRVFELGANDRVFKRIVMKERSSSALVQFSNAGVGAIKAAVASSAVLPSVELFPVAVENQLDFEDQAGPENTDDGDLLDVAPHDHNAKSWRLRRIQRSVLKDAGYGITIQPDLADSESQITQTAPSSNAPQFDRRVPLSAELQLLTRATVAGVSDLWTADALQGQVASLALAPFGDPDLTVRGALEMVGGQASSWVLAGQYAAQPSASHAVRLLMSYSKQSALPSGGLLPDYMTDTTFRFPSREVGSVEAADSWSVSPNLIVDYGTAFDRYGYLQDGALLSPHAAIKFAPFGATRFHIGASQQMTAPGAEQFLPPLDGLWLPPERTFTSLSGFDDLRAERTVHFEVGVEQSLTDRTVVGVKRFTQDVNDQLVAMFEAGRHVPIGTLPASGGHYYLTSASGLTADGWGVSVMHVIDDRVHGSVDYSLVTADWAPWTAQGLPPSRVGVFRNGFERFHDVTATVEATIPETATRVTARCRVNTAYATASEGAVTSGLDARYDIRVMQMLPFSPIDGSTWELLVAVRSLFHEQVAGGSVYDELLVVSPPQQVVGGLVVHF
ncbi:MAG: TonB-dependent receptor domain-containing protein [Vicinamibacterales bacterium]